MNAIKNRIVAHRRVKASQLKAHPLNPRTHPDEQRSVLRQLMEEIGLARSVLCYIAESDRPNAADDAFWQTAPLTLIDGHLRQEELGDQEVECEVLDVSDEEARTLLMAIDPLSQLAGYDASTLAILQDASKSPAVLNLWQNVEKAAGQVQRQLGQVRRKKQPQDVEEKYQVLIECVDEKQQIELLKKLRKEGLECKALIS